MKKRRKKKTGHPIGRAGCEWIGKIKLMYQRVKGVAKGETHAKPTAVLTRSMPVGRGISPLECLHSNSLERNEKRKKFDGFEDLTVFTDARFVFHIFLNYAALRTHNQQHFQPKHLHVTKFSIC